MFGLLNFFSLDWEDCLLSFLVKADWGLAEKNALHVFFSSPVVRKGSALRHLEVFSESM